MDSDRGEQQAPRGGAADDAPVAVVTGSGTSTGVPVIGCRCPVCTSPDPRDNRLRSGLHVQWRGFHLQIDVSPDFRQQALRGDIPRVDAVLVTHAHVDHCFGIDDLRRYNRLQGDARIPVYSSPAAIRKLDGIFDYLRHAPVAGSFLAQLDFLPIAEPLRIGPFDVTPFDVVHGATRTLGFRLDAKGADGRARSLAYVPDCNALPATAREILSGVDVLLLDALRDEPHGSHLTFDESIRTLLDLRVGRGFLTHIGHDVLHADLEKRCPPNIRPAHDRLRIPF